jgi:hypothetical protein
MTKEKRMMRKMMNRMLMKMTRQKMRKKKSKKIAKLVRRQIENEEHMVSDIDDTDEESDAGVSTNVHPKAKKQSSDNTLNNVKKSAHNENNVEDVMFKNLFSGDLKLKIAENVNKSSKSNIIGVYIC